MDIGYLNIKETITLINDKDKLVKIIPTIKKTKIELIKLSKEEKLKLLNLLKKN